MKKYTIQSYVPEKEFLLGKDARFCSTAFENCFVVDVVDHNRIIAAGRNQNIIGTTIEKAYSVSLGGEIFNKAHDFSILPSSLGTLLVYPAWEWLGFALVFHLKEDFANVEKARKNAQRYAFSALFDTEESNHSIGLESKLCALNFYVNHLFGKECEKNIAAHILMLANLAGCHLHEISVSHINFTCDEREFERLSAYLLCTFMTMRRHNGSVSTSLENNENAENLSYIPQEYGIRIQQSMQTRLAKDNAFDLPNAADIENFASHPVFQKYKIEETNGTFSLHIPLRQKVLLSSLYSRGLENEIIITLFPF